MGNVETVSGPSGYLICSTVRFGLGDDIGGFQFTRFDSTGNVLYTKAFSTGPLTNVMQHGSFAQTRSDGSFSFLFGNHEGWPAKWSIRLFSTSSQGEVNWNRKVEYEDPAYSIQFLGAMEQAFDETSDGGYLITGLRTPVASFIDTLVPMIVKLDGIGNVVWNKTYILSEKRGWHIVSHVDPVGSTLLGFHADTSFKIVSDNNILTRIDANGNTLWSKRIDGFNGRMTGSALVEGNYVISAMDSASMYILKIDTVGEPQWGKRYALNFPLWTWGASIVPTIDDGFVLTAHMPDLGGNADVYFFKVDSLGALEWERAYGDEYSQSLNDLIENEDGTFTMLTGGYYLSKLDATGFNDCMMSASGIVSETAITFSMVDVTLNEFAPPMISESLYVNDSIAYDPVMMDTCLFVMGVSDLVEMDGLKVYPNPTRGITTISIRDSMVGASFAIIDLYGQQVTTTTIYATEMSIDLGVLSSGIYLYRLVTPNGRTWSGKLLKY